MKKVCLVVLSLFVLAMAVPALAADPVDLSGKKGVVDPNDLKKYDPKPKPAPAPSNSGTSGNTSKGRPNFQGSYGIAK
jgi:hypothetical protein